MSDYDVLASEIRATIIKQAKRANVGHIGSALSVADILAVLYGGGLNLFDPDKNDRDIFVLSKGHAALALYAALFESNRITYDELNTYCTDGTLLGVHPEHFLPGVELSTGSLGHGLSMAAGIALAVRMRKSAAKVCVLVSDAECNEGSLWEAVMFSAHHKLDNLITIIDLNGQQALGYTENVLDLSPMSERWSSFGWQVHEVDGHDRQAMAAVLDERGSNSGRPKVMIARTTFGKGVSYMENKIKWHYWPMSDEGYKIALQDLEKMV